MRRKKERRGRNEKRGGSEEKGEKEGKQREKDTHLADIVVVGTMKWNTYLCTAM